MKPFLSIVIPARNEKENIAETVRRIVLFLQNKEIEIIVVNDHSSDTTAEEVQKLLAEFPSLLLIDNQKPPGFANALRTGWENAQGEFVLPVMADGCDDPQTIPLMMEKAQEGYDLICGCRYTPGGKRVGGPLIQGFFSWLVGRSLFCLLHLPTADISNAYKMYRRRVLTNFSLREKGFAISMEAALKFIFSGHRVADVPTIWFGRKKGKSKFRLSRTWPYIRLYWSVFVWKFSRGLLPRNED
ncbi:MAG: glycosyltransferase family 2 protein [Candidatus Omnitrophica bacterium]|nr:glycosyltransferase family 2 protein [Candidatus Omnitrophota bacterium]